MNRPNLRSVTGKGASRKQTGDNGGGGGLTAFRLAELERRVDRLEERIGDLKSACDKITTKVDELPSKSYVLWHTVVVVVVALFTLLGHLAIRAIGN